MTLLRRKGKVAIRFRVDCAGYSVRVDRTLLDGERHQADAMQFCNSITAKALVWLAAILLPAETLPSMACGCRCRTSPPAALKSSPADAPPAAKCSHCAAGSRTRHSCCGGIAASSAQNATCCKSKGSCCCCKSGQGSHGSPCQCWVSKSPAPAPLPNHSRTQNTKSSLAASSAAGLSTAVVLVPAAAPARAEHQPALHCSSAPERLSILCRLVI